MSRLQLLVTTMYQTDLSKYRAMNLQTDVFFANQADEYQYQKESIGGNTVEMLTTPTRGVSRNRNLAMTCANPNVEFIMFSDDDLILVENYEQLVCDEFERHPEAEAIKFNLEAISGRKLAMKHIQTFKKAGIRDVTASGVCGLAIRREVLIKNNLHFNEFFGPGTDNYCGEDSIFLQDLIKKKVGLYLSPSKIADIDQSHSTWYEGRTERYFITAGKVLAAIFPKLAGLLAVRSAYRFSKRDDTDMTFSEIYKCYQKGIKAFFNK